MSPQREEPRAAVPGLGPRGPGRDRQGEAGSSLHPAGMGTNARALWRPRNVSNSRTCAEAMLSVLPLQNKVDFP